MSLFGRRTADHRAAGAVEAALQSLGVDPTQSALPARGDGRVAWSIGKGSVEVYIVIEGDENNRVLRVFAPLLTVPPENLLPLFRRLLELNGDGLLGCAFGLRGDKVVLGAERSTQGLDKDAIRDLVLHVAHFADHFDDELVQSYGGSRHADG
jgi:type III secretion system-like peptide-binding chaperone